MYGAGLSPALPLHAADRRTSPLAALIERYCPDDGHRETQVPGLDLFRASDAGSPVCGVYRPVLAVIAQGCKRIGLGDETYVYDSQHCLVSAVDLPVTAQIVGASRERPYLCAVIELDPRRIADVALAMDLPRPAPAAPRGLGVSPLTPAVAEAVLRLVQLLETPEDIPFLAPLIERELLYRLLAGEQGLRLRALATADSQSQRTARAMEWIRHHYHLPLSIDALAETANMSKSSLHHHFKALTAMSPLQYQKQIRLQEARRILLTEDADAATVARRVGYESPSQFSREYRRQFGAPPLRDIARLR